MKFSIKIFICAMLMVAAAFSAGGYLLISRSFSSALNREITRVMEEHLSLRFMLQSGIITEELQNKELTEDTLRDVAEQIAQNMKQSRRNIAVHDSAGRKLFSIAPLEDEKMIKLLPMNTKQVNYHIEKSGSLYTICVTGLITYEGMQLYLSYMRDIGDVFAERNAQVEAFIIYDVSIVVISAAVLFVISALLTRPIRKLSAVSRRIAGGEYGERATVRSNDEIGELTESFNKMAGSVQDKIGELEKASKTKDEFIANFTHELKTPMTSIIGYADMLRSKECDSQTVFKAANYIFSEGKRLESLSLKMLDLMILEKHAFTLKPVNAVELLEYVAQCAGPACEQDGVILSVTAEDGAVMAEPDMMKTLLINITDNARKASQKGGLVELAGRRQGETYAVTVTDHGNGIPENELGRITEAFYIVDKSRARAQHGAGLGLAIASRIAELHNTKLNIKSIVGLGTSAGVVLALQVMKKRGGEDKE